MPEDPRQTLARRQAELARALVRGSAPPPGFDAPRVNLAAEALLRKRKRGVSKTWPRTAEALGARFDPLFDRFALEHPHPPHGGPIVDGWLFAEWLLSHAEPRDEIALELAGARLRFCREGGRVSARRWPRVVVQTLPESARLAIGVAVGGRQAWCRVRMPFRNRAVLAPVPVRTAAP